MEGFMPNAEREKEILKILEKKYNVSVKELADALYASEPTIRRDLISLEKSSWSSARTAECF